MREMPLVLVIDDDAMIRLLVAETLSKNGFEVVVAEDGQQGLALFASRAPDVVLLDIIMPDQDGFSCLQQLIEIQGCDVPVIMMTAVEAIDCVEQAYQLGVTDFIGKPIQWLLLPYRVQFVLRTHNIKQQSIHDQNQLMQSEERLRLSLEATKQGLWDLNVITGEVIVNAEYASMLGYDPEAFNETKAEWVARLHPDDRPRVADVYRRYLNGSLKQYRVEFRQRRADGSWCWILSMGSVVERDSKGRALRMLGTYTSIDSHKQAEEKLQLFAKVVEHSGEAIVICDAQMQIISTNRAFNQITGYSDAEVINSYPNNLLAKQLEHTVLQQMIKALEGNGYWQGEVQCLRKNGGLYSAWLGISVILNSKGAINYFIGIFSDISERKAAQAQIEYLAHHDPLTQLPNRALLQDRFHQAVAQASRNNSRVSLLFLDLDRFKRINDSLGHDVGDLLLKQIAKHLCHCIREVDTVCRQGGDEFIVILNDMPDIESVRQIALKILEQLHQPIIIQNMTVTTSFSIGISMYPDDGNDFDVLLNKADTAMYASKKQGRNTFRFFSEEMHLASMEHMNIENGLRLALEKDHFQLHYQPLFDLQENRIIGAEALLRWLPDGKASYPPSKFIPIAEDSGLILPIGVWVLEQACKQTRLWHDKGLMMVVSVNISAVQFRRGNLLEVVQAALEKSGLPPQYLELELNESVLMSDIEMVGSTINKLKGLGVSVAIDEFGIGNSSLSYLKRFAVNKIKIDQSFVQQLGSGKQEDLALVQAIIQLGDTLGIQTLAEGVETEEQAGQLARLGCQKGKGYFWHKPMPSTSFEALFAEHKAVGL